MICYYFVTHKNSSIRFYVAMQPHSILHLGVEYCQIFFLLKLLLYLSNDPEEVVEQKEEDII